MPGRKPADGLAAPYALVGAVDEVIDELDRQRERWRFVSYAIRAYVIDIVALLLERLRHRPA